MAETATLPSIAEHGASRLPSVERRQLQHRAEGRRRLHRRPRQQGRVPRHHRELAQAAAQGRRRSVRQGAERRDFQEDARRPAGQGRPRGRRHRAGRDRGIFPGAGAGHPPLSQDQGLEGHRADRGRRRLSRQPRRRTGDRPHRGDPQGRQGADRAGADPQRSRRGRPDRRRASRAEMAVQGARRDPRGRHRRHQHPRRRGRAQPEEGSRSVEGRRLEVRAVASRRREEGRPRRRDQEAGRACSKT